MYNELKKFFVCNRTLSLLQAMFIVVAVSLTITSIYANMH